MRPGTQATLPLKWSSTKASSAASTARASSSTSCWSTSRSSTTLVAMSRSPIARASGSTALFRISPAGSGADDAWPELLELADGQRRVHRRTSCAGPAAELLVADPQVDADGLALVGVDSRLAERRPAPRPDRVGPQLLRHPSRRERLQLDDLEPLRARLQSLASSRAGRGLELQLERDPARRDPDVGELAHELRACRSRIVRLARIGPSACSRGTFGEVKKTCRISSADADRSRHHCAASPPV